MVCYHDVDQRRLIGLLDVGTAEADNEQLGEAECDWLVLECEYASQEHRGSINLDH